MSGGTEKQQPLDNSLSDFVPSAVQSHNKARPTTPSIHPETGLLKLRSLTDEDLKELIDDPKNEGKAIVFEQEDVQQNPMQAGPRRTYKKGEQFNMEEYVAKGGYGEVQLIKDNTTDLKLIKKDIKKTKFKTKEIVAVKDINTKRFFPTLFGIMPHNGIVSIFMQYGGLSFNKLVTDPRFSSLLADENKNMEIARQGFSALNYFVLKCIIHLDIKPANLCLLLIGSDPHLMICDFGSCVMVPTAKNVTMSGWTPAYMAPEMCRSELSKKQEYKDSWKPEEMKISTQADVYSLALSIMYLKRRKNWMPSGFTSYKTILFVASNDPSKLCALIKPEWDKRLKYVLLRALSVRPDERIKPCEALDILPAPVMPADSLVDISPSSCAIVTPVNSSGDSQKGNASRKTPTRQSVQNESLPGNLPNLFLLENLNLNLV